jgi:hypothetical protein
VPPLLIQSQGKIVQIGVYLTEFELTLMRNLRIALGDTYQFLGYYWSSTEFSSTNAWYETFFFGNQTRVSASKDAAVQVHVLRRLSMETPSWLYLVKVIFTRSMVEPRSVEVVKSGMNSLSMFICGRMVLLNL